MGKPIFVKEDEKNKLIEIIEKGENYLKRRAKAILLSGIHKYRVSEISKILNIHPNHLRKWIHRYNKEGIEIILKSPKAGVRKRFGENIKNKIIEIVHKPPRKLGLLFSYWTLYRLKAYLENNRIVNKISHETIRRILKQANINLKKIKHIHSNIEGTGSEISIKGEEG